MPQIILSNVTVVFGGAITIGANCIKSVVITYSPVVHDNTGMGHTAASRKTGLEDWTIDIEIFAEYATGLLMQDLYAIYKAGGDVGAIDIGPTGVAVDADNPHFESTHGYMEGLPALNAGSVGELGVAKLVIKAMGAELLMTVA